MASVLEATIRFSIRHNLVNYHDLLFSNGYVRCKLTGNVCSTSCPQFSLNCKYSEYIPAYYTLGHLYYINKLAFHIYKDDRYFLIRLLGGEIDNSEEDEYVITDLIEQVDIELENVVVNKVTRIVNKETSTELNRKYPNLINFIEERTKEQKEKIQFILNQNPKLSSILQAQLKELSEEPLQRYSFDEYLTFITNYIYEGNIPDDVIDELIQYILTEYKPKNSLDKPFVRWSKEQVLKSPKNGLPPIGILYEDYRKWDNKRITLAENVKLTHRIIVVNDVNWVWFNLLKEDGLLNDVSELTYNDVMLRVLLSTLLTKLSTIYAATFIVLDNLNEEQINRLEIVLTNMSNILSQQKGLFTFNKLSQYLIKYQVDNLYKLTKSLKTKPDDSILKELISNTEKQIKELMIKLENDGLSREQKKQIKNDIKLLQERLNQLKKDDVTIEKILPMIVSYKLTETKEDTLLTPDVIYLIETGYVEKIGLLPLTT